MISIIICSRTQIISAELSANIKDTIGSDYELVVIDNSLDTYSIFEAYNLGIEKSTGEYLCFMHDDILIHTQNWGIVINNIFNDDQKIGLIGIAGARIKTMMPSGWWNCPNEFKEINIIQHLENKVVEKWEYGFNNGSLSEVVAIDGVFMVLRKDKRIHFDTELKGFHNYDLNISLECKNKEYKIVVTNEILIEHFSNGNINKSWQDSTMKIHELYLKNFPLYVGSKNIKHDLKSLEIKNGLNFLNQCLAFGFKDGFFKLWFKLFCLQPFSKSHFMIFKKCIKNMLNK
jgi:glycosyltransferase involved in cell wall biosynthesis